LQSFFGMKRRSTGGWSGCWCAASIGWWRWRATHVDPRTAALVRTIQRVRDALLTLGTYP
ncbi:MAG: hypothetical protein N0A24_12340, partial [Armatimonadetes bacterium]|nr:hypothetical protein [Armatimonadota bacterium]MDW8154955.1 hypothetical protein [Armatimonadota bacterium]